MNALAVPFRQLVERRLWPLALLLLAALAAVPLLLAKGEEPVAAPTASASAATAKAAAATAPIVTISEPAAREAKRRVLGSRKDPFMPAIRGKKASAGGTAATAPNAAGGSADKPAGGSGGALPGVTVPQFQTVPKKTYELYSLTVRFGDSTAESMPAENLKRLTALPSAEAPVVIYLGLKKNLRTAVFLVDASAHPQGDGRCVPHPTNCQTLELDPGETSFFDVTTDVGVAQYQLDYVRVKRTKTTSARAARASRSGTAAGRKALRARTSRLGAWRYDAKSGTLKRLSPRALKAEAAARAAR